jgi:RimJ/RimL family protein N-acetyltransferase
MPSHSKERLRQNLISECLRLALFKPEHRGGLKTACAADPDIWDIYPHSMLDEHFEPAVQAMLSHPNRIVFAALARSETAEKVVGMTSFINPDVHGVVEIGGTYIEPSVRGTGFNHAMKKLMIDHAFSCGYRRIEFRVDTRNQRSAAAVRKLGAQLDGVLRKNVVTWTGYVRDTYVFSLFEDEWRG